MYAKALCQRCHQANQQQATPCSQQKRWLDSGNHVRHHNTSTRAAHLAGIPASGQRALQCALAPRSHDIMQDTPPSHAPGPFSVPLFPSQEHPPRPVLKKPSATLMLRQAGLVRAAAGRPGTTPRLRHPKLWFDVVVPMAGEP